MNVRKTLKAVAVVGTVLAGASAANAGQVTMPAQPNSVVEEVVELDDMEGDLVIYGVSLMTPGDRNNPKACNTSDSN